MELIVVMGAHLVYVHLCACVSVCLQLHVCAHVYVCAHMCTCGLYASHTCAHVYLSYVCMCVNVNLHVYPPLSLKHTHTCQENPRDPGDDR